MTDWFKLTLGEIIELKRGYDLPERLRQPGRFPIVSSSGVSGTHSEGKISGPGVVTGRYGTIGQVHWVEESYWPLNTTLYVRDFKGNDPRFIKYLLQTIDYQSCSDKAAVPGVNRNHLHQLSVLCPPLFEQKAIANMLRSLDDKIELNRRMNETLEAMARALFKSWFVDFDPVRAKADGRKPAGIDEATARLFPSDFEMNRTEVVPRGWRTDSIYTIAEVVYGAPFSSAHFNSAGFGSPLLRIRDLTTETPAVWTTEVHPKGYRVSAGDVVVGMDGEFRAYLWGGQDAWLNQRLCVFKPLSGWSAAFIRNSIAAPLAHVEATETATTVIHLGKSDIDRFTAVIPSSQVTDAFGRLCQPWYNLIVNNKREQRSLATIRDALLPKLLSGELRVREAERLVEVVS